MDKLPITKRDPKTGKTLVGEDLGQCEQCGGTGEQHAKDRTGEEYPCRYCEGGRRYRWRPHE